MTLPQIKAVLDWYGEKSLSLQRYMNAKPPNTNGMEAVMIELSLDGGKRAYDAIDSLTSALESMDGDVSRETKMPPEGG